MQKIEAIIYGSGGLAKELISYMTDDDRYKVINVVSSKSFSTKAFNLMYPVEEENLLPLLVKYNPNAKVFLAIGDGDARKAIFNRFIAMPWGTYIHPSASVSRYAQIGLGCIITPQAIVTSDAILGRFGFMNTNATIGHDSMVDEFGTLMPNSEVCGDCVLGPHCFLGIGAYVLPGVTLPPRTSLSAGAVVRKSVLESGLTFYGNPAQPRDKKTGA